MKFFRGKASIPLIFEDFAREFPNEALVLNQYKKDKAYAEVNFRINENELSLMSKDYNDIKVEISKKLDYHQKFFYKNSIYKEPLARALGLKRGESKPHVLDATAGMMGDSLLMYSLGVESLTVAERNPIVGALICNALQTNQANIKFHFGSASSMTDIETKFDVILFDPMYAKTASKKSAPKKEMVIFRALIGTDDDSEEEALRLKSLVKKRLVIKRAIKAENLLPNPSFSILGKSTRYDVYLS